MASVDADAIILGGGIVGVLSALRLRQRGLDVVVIERARPGAEASGAAAGILAPQSETHAPGPLFELMRASLRLYPALVEELAATGVDVGFRDRGTLALAFDEDEAERLRARAAWQREAGLAVETLASGDVRALEPALAPCTFALRFPDERQVEAPNLMAAVALAASHAGVRLVTGDALRVLHDGARVRGVEVVGRTYEAAHVVVACGAWSSTSGLGGDALAERAVYPLRGQLLELDTRPPLLEHLVFADGGYLVPRSDGRVVVGSTEEDAGFQKEVTCAGLERLCVRARRVCPALAERPITRSWSGLRPASRDGLPLLGTSELAGLHVAAGHYRNGILLGPITAEIVAALVTSAPPPVDVRAFSPSRFR
jgi:glycine oxidase